MTLARIQTALDALLRWWCIHIHRHIINLKPDSYQCGRCLRVHQYDWWTR